MENIPNTYYKRAAEICDEFPYIDVPDIAGILYADEKARPLELNQPEDPAHIEQRRGRKKHRRVVLDDDRSFSFNNSVEMYRTFGILDQYNAFQNLRHRGVGNGIVEKEANAVKDILKKDCGLCIRTYSAYDFSGEWKTINFGEGEA